MDVRGGMVKLVYTEALKASSPQGECGFDSHSRYHSKPLIVLRFWRRFFRVPYVPKGLRFRPVALAAAAFLARAVRSALVMVSGERLPPFRPNCRRYFERAAGTSYGICP